MEFVARRLSLENLEVSAPTSKTELCFRKDGNTLVLKEIRIAGSTTGMLVPFGPIEKKAAKQGKPTKVTGTIAFDRKEFGMDSGIPFFRIANRVEVTIDFKATRVSDPPLLFKR